MKIFTQLAENMAPSDAPAAEVICLTFDDRKRGRLKIKTESGMDAGIQIERGQVLRHGTVLTNPDGDCLIVNAESEKVSIAYIEDPMLFARGCYHLGNRHVPLQIGEGFLRYQEDYVLDDMLHGLGIHVTHELATFEPENGAYAPGTGGHHHHPSDDDHAHSHNQEHNR